MAQDDFLNKEIQILCLQVLQRKEDNHFQKNESPSEVPDIWLKRQETRKCKFTNDSSVFPPVGLVAIDQ